MHDSSETAGKNQPSASRRRDGTTVPWRRLSLRARPWSIILLFTSLGIAALCQSIWIGRSAGDGAYFRLSDEEETASFRVSDTEEATTFRISDLEEPTIEPRKRANEKIEVKTPAITQPQPTTAARSPVGYATQMRRAPPRTEIPGATDNTGWLIDPAEANAVGKMGPVTFDANLNRNTQSLIRRELTDCEDPATIGPARGLANRTFAPICGDRAEVEPVVTLTTPETLAASETPNLIPTPRSQVARDENPLAIGAQAGTTGQQPTDLLGGPGSSGVATGQPIHDSPLKFTTRRRKLSDTLVAPPQGFNTGENPVEDAGEKPDDLQANRFRMVVEAAPPKTAAEDMGPQDLAADSSATQPLNNDATLADSAGAPDSEVEKPTAVALSIVGFKPQELPSLPSDDPAVGPVPLGEPSSATDRDESRELLRRRLSIIAGEAKAKPAEEKIAASGPIDAPGSVTEPTGGTTPSAPRKTTINITSTPTGPGRQDVAVAEETINEEPTTMPNDTVAPQENAAARLANSIIRWRIVGEESTASTKKTVGWHANETAPTEPPTPVDQQLAVITEEEHLAFHDAEPPPLPLDRAKAPSPPTNELALSPLASDSAPSPLARNSAPTPLTSDSVTATSQADAEALWRNLLPNPEAPWEIARPDSLAHPEKRLGHLAKALDATGTAPGSPATEAAIDADSTMPVLRSMLAENQYTPPRPPTDRWRATNVTYPLDGQLAMSADTPAVPGLRAPTPPGSLPAPVSEPAGPAAVEEVPPLHPRYQELFDTKANELTVNIKPPDGAFPNQMKLPPSQAGEIYSPDGMSTRGWAHTSYQWEATGLAHQPLYFEQVNLERYGYAPTRSRFGQSIVSAAHFFGSVFILPYRLGAEPIHEQQYVLGHYRPGSYAPYEIHRPPLSWKGGALETAAVVGLIFAIP